MNKRIVFLAALSLAALAATGCSADATGADDQAAESDLTASKQRTTFGGVSVGFGDKASSVISKLNAKGLHAESTEVMGYGPAVTAQDSDGLKLKALAAGGKINLSITVEGDDYNLDIRDEWKKETLKNGRVSVPRDVAAALKSNAMKFGSVSIELGTPIKNAAEAMGTIVREENVYGTAMFTFNFDHNGDPVAVSALTDGKIRTIEITHTETTGAFTAPNVSTTRFSTGDGSSLFNRVSGNKEENYWSNGQASVVTSTAFN